MRFLKQVKQKTTQEDKDLRWSSMKRQKKQGGEGPPGKRKSQLPVWKQIILYCLVGVSVIIVASWAVFSINPVWFASLKGRVVDKKASSIAKKKPPPPKHLTRGAGTAKTRTVPISAPTKPTLQQPKERIATAIERPQLRVPTSPTKPQARVPSDTTEPPGAIPSTLPKPRVSVPSSSLPAVEDNILEEYLEIGSLYARKGRYDKAAELFQKVTKENPSSAKAHNNLGFVYLKQEKYELAEKEFKDALRIDPASVLPYYNMACLYSRKGMEVEALIFLKRALKRDARVKLWAMTDEDFDRLRSDVVFEELVGISSSQTGGTFTKEGVQKQESAQERERTVLQQRIQIPLKTTAPEELETQEESQTPDETPGLEQVQPSEETQGDTPE
jgi:TolA-binding protein